MVAARKARAESEVPGRKHIGAKLTNEELYELRRIALDKRTTSVDIVTDLIRQYIRKNSR